MDPTYQVRDAFGGGTAEPAEAALVAAIHERLLAGGPATSEQLAEDEQLRALAAEVTRDDAPLDAIETADLIDEIIEYVDTGWEWVIDGRHLLPEEVVRDTVVTIRLDEDSAVTGDLFDGPDLSLLAMLQRDELPLADGGVATRPRPDLEDIRGPHSLRFQLAPQALPDGAAAGRLLALHWDGKVLTPSLLDDPPPGGAPDVLRAAFDHIDAQEVGEFVEGHDLSAVARIDHGLFTTPMLPVTELAGLAGLSVNGHRIAEGGFDWEAAQARAEQRRAERGLGGRHGLREHGVAVLLQALEATHRELGALLDGAPWPGPDRDRWSSSGRDRPPADDEMLRALTVELRHPDVAEALAREAGYDHPWLAPGLQALGRRIHNLTKGRDRAIAHHLLAVTAEVIGDVEEAAKQARLAVRAAPQHGPSLLLAARHASLRGRAAESLQHFTAAVDMHDGNALIEQLRQFARPGPTDAPRNAPCPCGSGRKHKVCCEPHNGWPLSERTGWLLFKARDHATGEFHAHDLVEVVLAMAGGEDSMASEREIHTLGASAFVQGLLLWDGGVLAEFLDTYAPLLPADELDLGRRWLDAALDLWEVTEVRPGEGVSLLGLYRGESVTIRERAWSQQARVGQTIVARVLDGVDHLELQAVWPVDLSMREYLLTEVLPHDPDHLEWAAALAPRPLQLTNRDGDELVMHTTTYVFDVSVDTVTAAMEAMGLESDDDTWAWMRPDDPERLIRGFLEVDGHELIVTTNSDARQVEMDTALREVFGDALEQVDHEVETIEDARARRAAGGADARPAPADLPPEAHEALAAIVRDAERRWVDESVPALGGLTPRQALDDPTRRGDLLALLDEFDAQPFGPATGGFDTDNLRRHLGLL